MEFKFDRHRRKDELRKEKEEIMSHAFITAGLAVFQLGIESGWVLLVIGAFLLLCPLAIYFGMRSMRSDRDRGREDSRREMLNKSNENKENIRRAG